MILLALFVMIAYYRLLPSKPIDYARPSRPIVYRTFTPATLLPYNGTGGKPVYLAVRSRVYDVTPGKGFYGPGGPYENFAGRDASRGLAFGSFDEDMLTENVHGPLDPLDDLDEEQWESLRGWEERFMGKYVEVGRLVAEGSDEAERERERERENEKEK